jgi:hypothetical protein
MLSLSCGASRECLPNRDSTAIFNIHRETSNKALNAINELHLTPFLMSFLASRDKLPLTPVISAGKYTLWLTAFCLTSSSSAVSLRPDRRQ